MTPEEIVKKLRHGNSMAHEIEAAHLIEQQAKQIESLLLVIKIITKGAKEEEDDNDRRP